MKNLVLFLSFFLVLTNTACQKKVEPAKVELNVTLPITESQPK